MGFTKLKQAKKLKNITTYLGIRLYVTNATR